MRLVGLWSFVLALAAVAAGADPLDKPAFTATPAELLAAAKAAPGDDPVVLLRSDVTYTFDERGSHSRRERLVFAIRQQVAVDEWGTLRMGWQPFYQRQPVVRGRVIAPDGTATAFDPSLAHDAPAVLESPQVFSDRRDFSLPLPRLVVGAVIEEEMLVEDREPLSAAGTVTWQSLARAQPLDRLTVTITYPRSRPVTFALRGPRQLKPRKRTVGDRVELRFDARNVAARDALPIGVPPELMSGPFVGLTSGVSWAAVAADYRAQVEARLAEPFTAPPELAGPPTMATVARTVAWLHAHVRYTGIELGDSAMIPAPPRETQARGFGDCKDKATLLVALLRGVGIAADLALLTTGPGWDTDPALPGLGTFDHAIVRAVVGGKDVWIDATEDLLAAGQLPLRDQGRQALIISAGARGLTVTPRSAAADNLVREVRDYYLSEAVGGARVVETSTEAGIFADGLRRWVRGQARKELETSLTSYATSEYDATFTKVSFGDPDDVATPFRLVVEAAGSESVVTSRSEVVAFLSAFDALAKLPQTFTAEDAALDRDLASRTAPYEWTYPHHYEIENRLHLPPGYAPASVPAPTTIQLGALAIRVTHAHAGDVYTVTYRLDTGKRRLTAAELRATRAAVRAFGAEDRPRLAIPRTAARLLDAGDATGAIAEARRLIALHPKEALHHEELADVYALTGMGLAARREVTLATQLEPKRAQAWYALGFYLGRDTANRQLLDGADVRAAEAAFRQALKLDPTRDDARNDLAALVYRDAIRAATPPVARLREALRLRAGVTATDDEEAITARIALSLQLDDAAAVEAIAAAVTAPGLRYRAAVVAAAMRGGDLLKALAGADATVRAEAAAYAVNELALARRYDQARRLAALVPGADGQVGLLNRRRAIDDRALDAADPAVAVAAYQSARYGAWRSSKRPWTDAVEQALRTAVSPRTRNTWFESIPVAVLRDLVFAATTVTSTLADRGGWRLQVRVDGEPSTVYVAKRSGKAIVVGSNLAPGPVARELRDALARKDLAWAQRLATWLVDDVDDALGDDLRAHRGGVARASVEQLELIAALVLALDDPAWATPRLSTCVSQRASTARSACARRLADAHLTAGRKAEAIAALEAMGAPGTPDAASPVALASALLFAGRRDDAAAVLDRALATDRDVVMIAVRAALASTDRTAARAAVAALTKDPGLNAEERNNLAWVQAYLGDPAAVATIEPSIANKPGPAERNTYAVALAEAGEPYRAYQALDAATADATYRPPDWYALGRIAEDYGLRDDARTYYARITTPPGRSVMPTVADFVAQRLAALAAP